MGCMCLWSPALHFFSSPTVIRLGRRVCCHCFSLRLFSCLLFLLLLSALPLLFLKCFRTIKGNLCIVFSFELLYVVGGGSRCPSCSVNVRFYLLKAVLFENVMWINVRTIHSYTTLSTKRLLGANTCDRYRSKLGKISGSNLTPK